jgi:hypothetical protein
MIRNIILKKKEKMLQKSKENYAKNGEEIRKVVREYANNKEVARE